MMGMNWWVVVLPVVWERPWTDDSLLSTLGDQPSAAVCGRWWWRRWFAMQSSPPTPTWVVCSSSPSWCPCPSLCCRKRSGLTSLVFFLHETDVCMCISVFAVCLWFWNWWAWVKSDEPYFNECSWPFMLAVIVTWFPIINKQKPKEKKYTAVRGIIGSESELQYWKASLYRHIGLVKRGR